MPPRIRVVTVVWLALVTVTFARVDTWPDFFKAPSVEVSDDSSTFDVDIRQTVLENTFESHDRITVRYNDSLQAAEQVVGYELVNDHVLGTTDQHLDLSGNYSRHGRRWSASSIGFEWSPSFLLHTRDSGNGFLGTIDMGPIFGVSALGVPIDFRGGVTGRKWSDTLPRDVSTEWLDMMPSDLGFYGGLEVGDGGARVGTLPLYLGGSGYARLIERTSRLSVGNGQVLFMHDIPSGDSVFAYLADTLAWGHERFFERGTYVSIPERLAHSVRMAAAIKGKNERTIAPAFVYSFVQYS
ncbi:MAG: hypothetical protein GF344_00920, partial [Chitinivibrionales bacterium]|nr:hypothetical protein [Chitinivibrionales bacterium]